VAAWLGWAEPVVLVTGFWRSGTTWLQETLAEGLRAKTIFEPLSPENPRYKALIAPARLGSHAAQQGYIPSLIPDRDEGLWRYLDEIFKGRSPGGAALICRKRVRESFRRRIVVKDVRMQFSLAAVIDSHPLPLVHIRRNPRAVVASLMKSNWDWSFADLTLRELFEPHADDLAAFVKPELLETCLRLYDSDPVSRIAAYWALTEVAVDVQFRGIKHGAVVEYEELLADPPSQVRRLCDRIKLQLNSPFRWDRDSAMTTRSSKGTNSHARANGWRKVLSDHDARRVEAIADAIGEGALVAATRTESRRSRIA
jgi:hypothetical protein